MKIIVDNGGTKSDWAIVENNTQFSANGVNVFAAEDEIVVQIQQILPKEILELNNLSIDFYTAGLTKSIKHKLNHIFSKYFDHISIRFFSDMLCASRALFQYDKGIACILGTGSNCAYFDGSKNHEIIPSLGYIFGDEGSGYYLGKELLTQYFLNRLTVDLEQALEKETKMNKDELMSSLYSSEKKKFDIANFSFFLKKHESEAQIQQIINTSFLQFLSKYPFQYPNYSIYKFGFIGSVAFHFSSFIDEIMTKKRLEYIVIKKPITHLIKYYQS